MGFQRRGGFLRALAKLIVQLAALERERGFDGTEAIGKSRGKPLDMRVDSVGGLPALFNDGFLEHQQAAGEGFVDPVGMSCDGIDCFIRGFREALVEIIGLIANRRNRLLRGRVEILR